MITMKAGQRNQKPIINYSYDYSATRLVSDVNTLNADEYKMLFLEAITNSAKADGFEDVNLYPMYQKVTAPGYFGEEDTPWMKHIMRKALLSNIGSPSGVEARISDIMLLLDMLTKKEW